MLALILGDPHLGSNMSLGKTSLGSNINSRTADQLRLLDWTLQQAIENMVSHIIITGDVFDDPRPHPSIITLFIDWLKRCEINQINVHIIVGNHDIFRTGTYYTSALNILTACELENVSVYKDITTVILDKVAFTFVPFRDRKALGVQSNKEALEILSGKIAYEATSLDPNQYKIVVGHLALEGAIPVGNEIDDLANELMCPLSIFNTYNQVWMGHIHKPQVMSKQPYMAHIGSMDISNFGETEQSKYIVLIDNNNPDNFRREILPTRSLKKINISVPSNVINTTEYIVEEIAKLDQTIDQSILKIEIHLSSPELVSPNKAEIEKAFYKLGANHISSISEYKKLGSIKQDINSDTLDMKMDVVSAIKMYANTLDKEKQEKFTNLALRIYDEFRRDVE